MLIQPYTADLSAVLAARSPEPLVIDFSDTPLPAGAVPALAEQHRQWRSAGWSIAYAALRSGTRGALVVMLNQAADLDSVVATSVAQAVSALERPGRRLSDALSHFGLSHIDLEVRPSTWQTRAMATGFSWMGSLQNGYKTPFIEAMLRLYGVSAMPQLGPALQGALDDLTEEKGELHAQAVAAFAALGNGCPLCSYGHLYAADLLFFEESGKLGPIAPAELAATRDWTDAQVTAWIGEHMVGPTWAPIATSVLRMQALRDGAEPADTLDAMLLRILAAWILINECSLQTPVSAAPPLHPRMARARRLQRAYRAARDASRAA